MKSIMTILTLAAALTTLSAPGALAENLPLQVEIPVDYIFAPKGFDDNDSSEIVVSGMLQNLCYKAPRATATVEGNLIKVRVTALHVRSGGGFCAQMWVPFTEVVSLGVMRTGSYTVK